MKKILIGFAIGIGLSVVTSVTAAQFYDFKVTGHLDLPDYSYYTPQVVKVWDEYSRTDCYIYMRTNESGGISCIERR